MENTESLDADVILPGAEFRRMRADNEHPDATVCRLELFVAELQGDLGAALNDRDRLAAENARLREFVADAIRSLAHEEERLDSLREHAELEEFADLEVALASGTIATLLRAARSLTEAQP